MSHPSVFLAGFAFVLYIVAWSANSVHHLMTFRQLTYSHSQVDVADNNVGTVGDKVEPLFNSQLRFSIQSFGEDLRSGG